MPYKIGDRVAWIHQMRDSASPFYGQYFTLYGKIVEFCGLESCKVQAENMDGVILTLGTKYFTYHYSAQTKTPNGEAF